MPIEGWRALRVNGAVTESKVRGAGLADPEVCEALVRVDSGAMRVKVKPESGERLRVFTHRQMAVDARGNPQGGTADTVVVEIVPDPDKPDRVVRLYIGAEVLLSTE